MYYIKLPGIHPPKYTYNIPKIHPKMGLKCTLNAPKTLHPGKTHLINNNSGRRLHVFPERGGQLRAGHPWHLPVPSVRKSGTVLHCINQLYLY